jgi:hypothetical protein
VAAVLVLLSSGQLAAMEGNFWMTHDSKYSLACVYPMMHTPGKATSMQTCSMPQLCSRGVAAAGMPMAPCGSVFYRQSASTAAVTACHCTPRWKPNAG